MYRFPAPSTATPDGWYSCAAVAAPPSPPKPYVPLPATVVISPVAAVTAGGACPARRGRRHPPRRGRRLPDAAVEGVRDVQVAHPVHRDTPRVSQLRRGR